MMLFPFTRRHGDILSHWKDHSTLRLLNLTYDLTSPELVAMVITGGRNHTLYVRTSDSTQTDSQQN